MPATVFKKIIKSEILFVLFFTIVILVLNLTPMILQARHAPSDRVFSLVHNNIQDFYFYQSIMNQGANGAWFISDPYTTEPHRTSFIFAYFAWAGKISRILGIPYVYFYHFIRIFSGLFLFILSYFLIKKLSIPYPRLTFFFFVFAQPFLYKKIENGVTAFIPYMNWWTGMDAIRRAAYLPHHIIGALFLILSVILLLSFWEKIALKTFLMMIILSLLMSFIHTPSLFILLLVLPPSLFIYFISTQITFNNYHLAIKIRFADSKKYIGLLAYWFIGLLALFFMVSQTNKGFPWSQYLDWEKNLQFPLNRELIGALGILSPFALIGLIKSLFSKKFSSILIACWLVVPLLLIPLAPKLNISNIRLIQGIPYLPLSILAVSGLSVIKKFKSIFIGLFLLLFIVFTLPTLNWSIRDQIREYWNFYSNVYLYKNLFPAMTYINKNHPPKTRTLSTFYTGNYLPAYTDTVSFVGHFGYTYKLTEKQVQSEKFFGNKMTVQEAKDLLLNNKIELVFQGNDEKSYYNNYLYPTLLKPVFDQDGVTVYIPFAINSL